MPIPLIKEKIDALTEVAPTTTDTNSGIIIIFIIFLIIIILKLMDKNKKR